MLKAGRLDRRITIQRATNSDNAMGEAVPAWSALATVWAEVKPAPGTEQFTNEETAALGMTVFVIRWSSTVASVGPKDRISYAGRTYDIQSAIEIGRREGIQITASSRRE